MTTEPIDSNRVLTTAERDRLDAIREAESLSTLVSVTDADSEHDAYVRAKREWYDLRGKGIAAESDPDGLPGVTVEIDGHSFTVHGITHAGTDEEGSVLREHVSAAVDRGATVYCEQGIRPLYFSELGRVCEMDDYGWALDRCATLEGESHLEGCHAGADGPLATLGIEDVSDRFREAAFSLIESGSELYGEEVTRSPGAVAASFLTGREERATARDFTSSAKSRRAAREPDRLRDLQVHYERTFLPQPLEREWLRRHDPELELVTHARNERMADYAVAHNERSTEVLLIVGAAHQPGVRCYLERHRDGLRDTEGFSLLS
ncbi:hypothetical protein [Natronorarus salvus]|uniref:hypothetical protein n=1 Tax=Natronorarus salvus TaxID=3117733 RepID=UPI002F26D2EE